MRQLVGLKSVVRSLNIIFLIFLKTQSLKNLCGGKGQYLIVFQKNTGIINAAWKVD